MYLHAGLCHSLGIRRLEDGVKDDLQGVIGGPRAPMYFHKVKIIVYGESFETMAGFSSAIAVTGLLGRRGFFENFAVKIDASTSPPYCKDTSSIVSIHSCYRLPCCEPFCASLRNDRELNDDTIKNRAVPLCPARPLAR